MLVEGADGEMPLFTDVEPLAIAPTSTAIVPLIVTSPVARSIVPLGTVNVTPALIVIFVYCRLRLAGGDVTQLVLLLIVNAPCEPSP